MILKQEPQAVLICSAEFEKIGTILNIKNFATCLKLGHAWQWTTYFYMLYRLQPSLKPVL